MALLQVALFRLGLVVLLRAPVPLRQLVRVPPLPGVRRPRPAVQPVLHLAQVQALLWVVGAPRPSRPLLPQVPEAPPVALRPFRRLPPPLLASLPLLRGHPCLFLAPKALPWKQKAASNFIL